MWKVIFSIVVIFFILFFLFLMWKLWKFRRFFLFSREKASSFECGFDGKMSFRSSFSFRFFYILMMFLIFDVELGLLLGLPLISDANLWEVKLTLNLVLFMLMMGLFLEWKKGALDWKI